MKRLSALVFLLCACTSPPGDGLYWVVRGDHTGVFAQLDTTLSCGYATSRIDKPNRGPHLTVTFGVEGHPDVQLFLLDLDAPDTAGGFAHLQVGELGQYGHHDQVYVQPFGWVGFYAPVVGRVTLSAGNYIDSDVLPGRELLIDRLVLEDQEVRTPNGSVRISGTIEDLRIICPGWR